MCAVIIIIISNCTALQIGVCVRIRVMVTLSTIMYYHYYYYLLYTYVLYTLYTIVEYERACVYNMTLARDYLRYTLLRPRVDDGCVNQIDSSLCRHRRRVVVVGHILGAPLSYAFNIFIIPYSV